MSGLQNVAAVQDITSNSGRGATIGTNHKSTTGSKGQIWAGRIISGICILFLLFDALMKLLKVAPVIEAQSRLQIPEDLTVTIGVLVLFCTVVYAIPRTAILGAIFMTGYLGGAVAIQLRIGADLFSLLFPVIFATLLWGGLFLRDGRLRALVPLRRN